MAELVREESSQIRKVWYVSSVEPRGKVGNGGGGKKHGGNVDCSWFNVDVGSSRCPSDSSANDSLNVWEMLRTIRDPLAQPLISEQWCNKLKICSVIFHRGHFIKFPHSVIYTCRVKTQMPCGRGNFIQSLAQGQCLECNGFGNHWKTEGSGPTIF